MSSTTLCTLPNRPAAQEEELRIEKTRQQQKPKRRVHFADYDQVRDIEVCGEEAWVSAEVMRYVFRQDVIAFLKEFKRHQDMAFAGQMCMQIKHKHDDDDDDDDVKEEICSRGLEQYYPGEMDSRRKIRSIYVTQLVRKHELFQQIFPDSIDDQQDQLGQLARALSSNSRKLAHAVALQDAAEARLVYAESLLTETTSKDVDGEPVVPLLFRCESKTTKATPQARAA